MARKVPRNEDESVGAPDNDYTPPPVGPLRAELDEKVRKARRDGLVFKATDGPRTAAQAHGLTDNEYADLDAVLGHVRRETT